MTPPATPQRPSTQIIVDEIDTECMRRAFERSVLEGQVEMQRQISKHRLEARLYEISKVEGEFVAIEEAAQQVIAAAQKMIDVAKAGRARTRIARLQAMGQMPESEPR